MKEKRSTIQNWESSASCDADAGLQLGGGDDDDGFAVVVVVAVVAAGGGHQPYDDDVGH